MTEAVYSPDTDAFAAAKDAQARAADPIQSAWVEANAGSGKTKVLIDRVARLLLRRPDRRPGAKPDSILCITYTKAAANEMMARLYDRLGAWAVADDETLRASLSDLEHRAPADYTEEDFQEARRLFARALETPGGLRIETIHAFCARVLRRFPLEAGISPGFVAIEEDEANAIWQAVLAKRLEHAAIGHPNAMKILADATGGRGISAALDALKYQRQALIAFRQTIQTEKDMISSIQAASGAGPRAPTDILDAAMGTDLPIAVLERARQDLMALTNPGKADAKLLAALSTVLSSEASSKERYQTYMSVLAGARGDFPERSNPYTAKASESIVDLFSRNLASGAPEGSEITRMKAVQAALKAAALAERSIALMQIGLPLINAYQDEKRRRGALDFDDLIARTRVLLTQSNAAEWVLYKLDGGLSHLLLDEAQDTSPAQWALINALVEEFQSGLGRDRMAEPRTLFVVGDSKQSIYSFQGADQQQFEAERQGFLRRDEIIANAEGRAPNLPEMAMSFRSAPEVLRFVDEVRARVPLAGDATDPLPPPDANVSPHAPRRANQSGRVELWPLEVPTGHEGEDSAWTTPTDHVPADAPRRRLARKIARSIRGMLDRGETIWREQADRSWARVPIQEQDILILVRSRNDLFEALIESLKQEQISVAGADRLRLLDNLGVQDCLNLIRFALQPGDNLTLAEILRGPFCGLVNDDHHLYALAHNRPRGCSLWMQLQAADPAIFGAARDFCQSLIDQRDKPAYEFLLGALTDRDPTGVSGWDKLIQRLGEPVRDPVQALLSGALLFDMSKAKSLQVYLATIEGRETILKRELGEPEGAVRVMTVHGAKGLQSPIVILPDTTGATKTVTDDVFFTADGVPLYSPSSQQDGHASRLLRDAANRAAERESRRLLYVALTRAADRLIIAGAATGNTAAGYAKSSWYRWCLTAMQALQETAGSEDPPDTILSFGPEPRQSATAKTAARSGPPEPPSWLKQTVASANPPLRLAAPSRLAQDRSQALAPFGPKRSAALRRGRLIHSLLQILPEKPPETWAQTAETFLAAEPELTPEMMNEMIGVTMKTLRDPAFHDVFAPGGRSEAAIVGTLPDGQIVNGRVDRLILGPDKVMIIDYKTDRPAPTSASAISDAYRIQMAAYRVVLASLYPDRPVHCALLYTDGPALFVLDPDEMSESLNRIESRV
ncbi:MAG: double-strand break repair helicase AddA [Pseudomonadota bacterium]